MEILLNILNRLFGYYPYRWKREDDPIFHRYATLDRRVENLNWRPRDLLDIR